VTVAKLCRTNRGTKRRDKLQMYIMGLQNKWDAIERTQNVAANTAEAASAHSGCGEQGFSSVKDIGRCSLGAAGMVAHVVLVRVVARGDEGTDHARYRRPAKHSCTWQESDSRSVERAVVSIAVHPLTTLHAHPLRQSQSPNRRPTKSSTRKLPPFHIRQRLRYTGHARDLNQI
jgi:hypothetical protein